MTRVAASFVGCKVSQADGEEALAGLAAAGLEPVTVTEAADVVVVHTCCVTAEAERKSRRLVRRAASAGRHVVVSGCAAALHPEQFAAEGVTVAARPDWSELAGQLAGHGTRGPVAPAASVAAAAAAPRATPGVRTRLVLKVQDGCSGAVHDWSAVRLVRGAPRSVPLAQVLAAAPRGSRRGAARWC